jgi:hypothetical protein
MTALGYSMAKVCAPPGCIAYPVAAGAGPFTLMALASVTTPYDARARLAAQLTCLTTLDGFVPFSAQNSPPLKDAELWLQSHAHEALSVLERLRGHGQLTLTATTTHKDLPLSKNGTHWLCAKAEQASVHRQKCEDLHAHVTNVTTDLGITRPTSQPHMKGLRFDLLVPMTQASEMRTAIAQALGRPCAMAAHWHMALTGPWPAYAFWSLEDIR